MLACTEESCHAATITRSVKLHLSAIRRLCDTLVVDQVLPFNPASSVKSPRFSAGKGVTPVLSPEETRELFASVKVTGEDGLPRLIGLRDRAILAVMVYTVWRITAVVGMRVCDFYQDQRKWRVRLHEKGGKLHEVWAHHNLSDWLGENVEAAGIAEERDAPLFRSSRGRSGVSRSAGYHVWMSARW